MIIDYKLDNSVFGKSYLDSEKYMTRPSNKRHIVLTESYDEYDITENSILISEIGPTPEKKIREDFGVTKLLIFDREYYLYFKGFYAITKEVLPSYTIRTETQLCNLCRFIFKTLKYNIGILLDTLMLNVLVPRELILKLGLIPNSDIDEKSLIINNIFGKIAFNRDFMKYEEILALIRLQGELLYVTSSEPYEYGDSRNNKFVPYITALDKNPITEIEFIAILDPWKGTGWKQRNISLVHINSFYDTNLVVE
ncbi:MAG: hypothetical protein ACRC0G_07480 [Fusobacteriaceae bacterium]